MARPRKPTALIALTGGLAHNPKRYADRANEPKPTGPIGDPPDWLNEFEAEAWRMFVAEAPPGVLTNADRGNLELACTLRALVKQRLADSKDRCLLRNCYIDFGMTPASRSKVSAGVKKEEPENLFAAV